MTRKSVGRFVDLAREILRQPARLGPVRLVAIDGPTGSGKTTFASRLARALVGLGDPDQPDHHPCRVEVVHTDDMLDGWEDQFSYWDRLMAGVLAPLQTGAAGWHPCYDWTVRRFTGGRIICVPDVLVVEGGGSARARSMAVLVVFITAPEPARWARVIRRDGEATAEPLRRWMVGERHHFARDDPRNAADLVVDGMPDQPHDPDQEYVRLVSSEGMIDGSR